MRVGLLGRPGNSIVYSPHFCHAGLGMFLLKIEQYLCDLLAGLFGVFQTPKDIAHVPASLIFHALCFLGVCEEAKRAKKASGVFPSAIA
jgi:hypothetical protein